MRSPDGRVTACQQKQNGKRLDADRMDADFLGERTCLRMRLTCLERCRRGPGWAQKVSGGRNVVPNEVSIWTAQSRDGMPVRTAQATPPLAEGASSHKTAD